MVRSSAIALASQYSFGQHVMKLGFLEYACILVVLGSSLSGRVWSDQPTDAIWVHEDHSVDAAAESLPMQWSVSDSESFEMTPMHETHSACACQGDACHGACKDPGHPAKPMIDRPGDRSRADNPPKRYCMGECRRTGAAQQVHRFAKCSVNEKYSAWFVGGGAAFFRGRCRTAEEGTWGLDYSGLFGKANVWMKYTRGRKQGGEGKYETDGEPKVVSKANELLGIGH